MKRVVFVPVIFTKEIILWLFWKEREERKKNQEEEWKGIFEW